MAKIPTYRRRKVRQVPILIVEDNADQWLIIRSALSQCFPEVEPIWLNNADQTIKYLETHAADPDKLPRLILSDLYLPRREDGLSVLEFVKNHEFYRKPPIIILSSSQDDEDIAKVYSFSVASYIVKPDSYREWLNCFYAFQRYWWGIVKLPLRPQ
ncbi:response regulator [Spirosoma flavum]|uniref:Response regulator n=1 Tax=Spirosoma flavum TaxID=2048557 RepID=A0ABW6AP86_9BACT